MRLKTTKRLLNLASLAVLASACAVGYWGFMPCADPNNTANESTATDSPISGTSKKLTATPLGASPLAAQVGGTASAPANWGRPLRRPLFDPPPVVAIVVKPPPQPLRVKLLATVVEPENSTAMLKHANGQVVFCKVGDSLGADEAGTEILKIETGSISVRRGQEQLRLTVEGVNGSNVR
jgi:hypothetical protein